MSKTWWTVFAVYADTEEGYVQHVEATDVTAAKAKAYREAESVILIAGVAAGKINSVEEPASDVTPLRGRGHAIAVSQVQVTERKIVVPSRCPKCKADMRKPHAVTQADLVIHRWAGHLTKTGDEVSAEKNQHMGVSHYATVTAVKIRCTACSSDLWNGVKKDAN